MRRQDHMTEYQYKKKTDSRGEPTWDLDNQTHILRNYILTSWLSTAEESMNELEVVSQYYPNWIVESQKVEKQKGMWETGTSCKGHVIDVPERGGKKWGRSKPENFLK